MNEQHDELFSFIVPLAELRIILPRVCVSEIVGYDGCRRRLGGPRWLVGEVDSGGQQVPVVSFEGACGGEVPEPGSRTRIALLGALGGLLESGAFGILTQGFPQLVRVNAAVLTSDPAADWPAGSPVLCELRVASERALIPDLYQLEAMIAEQLRESSDQSEPA